MISGAKFTLAADRMVSVNICEVSRTRRARTRVVSATFVTFAAPAARFAWRGQSA
jgi:hypothetical protein